MKDGTPDKGNRKRAESLGYVCVFPAQIKTKFNVEKESSVFTQILLT
jgi:hypothetical protein